MILILKVLEISSYIIASFLIYVFGAFIVGSFAVIYICSSSTFYSIIKKKEMRHACWMWIPILKSLRIIELAKGTKLIYLLLFLMVIPKVNLAALSIYYFYMVIMKYKIIKEYKGSPLIFLAASIGQYIFTVIFIFNHSFLELTDFYTMLIDLPLLLGTNAFIVSSILDINEKPRKIRKRNNKTRTPSV